MFIIIIITIHYEIWAIVRLYFDTGVFPSSLTLSYYDEKWFSLLLTKNVWNSLSLDLDMLLFL